MEGVLLTNLGTPHALNKSAIRQFLREFLSDPRVVEIPRLLWLPILHGFILPFRPGKTLALYQTIWQENGSPLFIYSQAQTQKLQAHFNTTGQSIQVELGMRYGEPSIAHALEKLCQAGVKKITILPLYPQYSAATTGSTWDAVNSYFQGKRYVPSLNFISGYATFPFYIEALANSIRQYWQSAGKPELLLFSFHGIPKRCIQLGDPYADQCQATAKLIADNLGLSDQQWRVVFQSRFGKAEWLKPYCVDTLEALPKEGIKHIHVICPGFSVDCLETMQEINLENKHIFMAAGGERYEYIPALNDSEAHVEMMVELLKLS